jgi:purine-nucleoside/S-methyl-5'-thioadenosine phosphorylase / adenosine deaminase
LHQVHGATVVTVTRPGEHAGVDADAAITRVPEATLAVRTADCVPIVLEGDGVIGVVHAGWRGLAAGIVGTTIAEMGDVRRATIGPHIRAGCYEFGPADLDTVAAALGDGVRATTTTGQPALDLTAAVRATLGDVEVVDHGACTACTDLYFSWRARKETARFATLAWMS